MLTLQCIPDSWVIHSLTDTKLGRSYIVLPDTWNDQGFIAIQEGSSGGSPLMRVHSRCDYGDVLGSTHCDCRAQLELSFEVLRKNKTGSILFYLNQEGRGAGLNAKSRAYIAESKGIDTFSFYRNEFGSSDLRTYSMVSEALKALQLTSIRLLTNNLKKVEALEKDGIAVQRVSLRTHSHPSAHSYLQAKKAEGHLL